MEVRRIAEIEVFYIQNMKKKFTALVGGPSKNDSFADVRLDWSQTEVALDYNAPYQNILAYQVMFHAEDPFYMTGNDGSSPYVGEFQNSGKLPAWGFALAIVLPVMVLLGIAVGAFVLIRRRQRDREIQEEVIYAIHSAKNRHHSREMEEQRRPVKQLNVMNDSSSQMPLNATVGGVGSASISNEKIDLPVCKNENISSSSMLDKKSEHEHL